MHCFMIQVVVPSVEADKLQGHSPTTIEEVRVGQSKENCDRIGDYQQIFVTDKYYVAQVLLATQKSFYTERERLSGFNHF